MNGNGQQIRAAGGVVWRPGGEGVEVVLVRRPKYQDWTLPKGKLEPGETWEQAAVREVGEETGLSVVPGPYLGEIAYPERHTDSRSPRRKVVRYWAMRAVGGSFTPHDEIDAVRWLPAAAVTDELTYPNDRIVMVTFLDLLVRDEHR